MIRGNLVVALDDTQIGVISEIEEGTVYVDPDPQLAIDHPDVQETVKTSRDAAVDTGVPVGVLGFGMNDVNEKTQNGYQMLNLGNTTGAL